MCTWAPTPRVRASFAAAFPHVLAPRDRSFLLGSNQPIANVPEVLAARAHDPSVVRYLGTSAADGIAVAIAKLGSVEDEPADEARLIHDLFPRDEFLTP